MGTLRTPLCVTGFEHGYTGATGTAPDKLLRSRLNNAGIQSSVKRSGSYAMRVYPASGARSTATRLVDGPSGISAVLGRFYIRFASFPDANSVLWWLAFTDASTDCPVGFEFNAATNRIRCWARNNNTNTDFTSSDSGTALSIGVWYRVAFRITRPSSQVRKFEWLIAPEGETGSAEADFTTATIGQAGGGYYVFVGYGENIDRNGTGINADYYVDDELVLDSSLGDTPAHPVGDGRVILLRPNADGSHSTSASFTDEASNTPPASVYDRLDELPLDATTGDWVKQTTIGASDYLQVGFEDAPAFSGPANAAVYRVGIVWETAGVGARYEYRVIDTVNSQQLAGITDTSGISTAKEWLWFHLLAYLSGTANFEKAEIDGLVLRYGFSTDVTPGCRLHDAHIELDYPEEETLLPYWGVLLS